MNYKTFVSDFYNFSTRVLGLNANPFGINNDNFWYNADRFLRESGFFENASPKVFNDSTYCKRRELVFKKYKTERFMKDLTTEIVYFENENPEKFK